MKAILSLSENEQKVLRYAEFHAEQTYEQIAKKARLKSTTVAAIVRRLYDRGIIRRTVSVDPIRLGYQYIGIFFSISGASPEARRKVVKKFISHQNIGWFGILAGQFQYGGIYLCRHIGELGSFLNEVSETGAILHDRVLTPRMRYTRYTRRYLYKVDSPPELLTFSFESPFAEVDQLDLRILKALDANGELSLRDLAKTLKTPLTTIDRRVQKLIEERVIRGFLYQIDVEKLGISMSRILVQTRGTIESARQLIQAFCSRCPHITYLVEAMGTWTFEIGFESLKTDDDVTLLHNFYDQCGDCISSSIVIREMKDLKFSYAPWSV